MIIVLIIIGSLVVGFGIFNYIIALLDSKNKDVGGVHWVALKVFLALVLIAECVGVVFLSKKFFNYDNVASIVVQAGSVILFVAFSIRVIIDYIWRGEYSYTDEIMKRISRFLGQTTVAFATAIILTLSARSFMYIYGEIGAIINYLVISISSMVIPIKVAFTEEYTDSYMVGWTYKNKWVAILYGLVWSSLVACACYVVAFIVFLVKSGAFF